MHRLLGAVHEAAVQLSELPVSDVAAALLQVLHGTQQDLLVRPTGQELQPPRPPTGSPPTGSWEALTVSRSRRKRMLGTR